MPGCKGCMDIKDAKNRFSTSPCHTQWQTHSGMHSTYQAFMMISLQLSNDSKNELLGDQESNCLPCTVFTTKKVYPIIICVAAVATSQFTAQIFKT